MAMIQWFILLLNQVKAVAGIGGWAALYDVVGSVKGHVECASCGQLVFAFSY
jgi:hypothetical protein